MDKQTQTALAIIAGLLVAFVAGGFYFTVGSGIMARASYMHGGAMHGVAYMVGDRGFEGRGRMMDERGSFDEHHPWAENDGYHGKPGPWDEFELEGKEEFDDGDEVRPRGEGRRGGRGFGPRGQMPEGFVPPMLQDGEVPPCGGECPLGYEVEPEA